MKYTVKGGDSLSSILKRYNVPGWNTPAVWNKLVPQLRSKNYNQIRPGEVIDLSPVLPAKTTTPTKTAAPAPVSQAVTGGQQAAADVPKIPFEQMLAFQQFFPEQLARSSIAQRSARYYDPLVAQAQEGIMGDYADRGLSRSGQRARTVMDTYRDFADKEATMREQLYGNVFSQAKEDYGYQRGLYEKNPTGYKKSTFDKSNYTYQFPDESPQKYSQSYRDWLRNTYKI